MTPPFSAPFSLAGKTALITGASGGLGAAIASHLHSAGASVVLAGRNAEKLETLKASLGERAHVVIGDLGDAAGLAALAVEAEKADILINNAGLTKDGLLMRMSDEAWAEVIAVNLTAAFTLARAAVKGMMKRRWGRIISISSVVGVMGNAGQANYAASKAGLIGFTKALAQEAASRNITANCIAPGFIATAMTDALNEAQRAAMLARIPAGRFGEAADIAAAALYLASEQASYVTGQTLHVNGGMVMV
jgi:3-oxoacyl-[acyl-carrier protein] reductase